MSAADSRILRKPPHIFHVAYYDSLLKIRAHLLESRGYIVTSVLGNGNACATPEQLLSSIDLVLIGFSTTYEVRSKVLRWFKERHPEIPVVVLQAHSSEKFPDAECATLSEDPQTWLETIASCLKHSG